MMIIAVLGGKGGVRKSTLARAICVRLAQRGSSVVGADMDSEQDSLYNFAESRKRRDITPTFPVQNRADVRFIRTKLPKLAFDAAVIDGAAYASRDTLAVAEVADLVVLPTGYSPDDIGSVIKVHRALVAEGVPSAKIIASFCGVVESAAQHKDALATLQKFGVTVHDNYVPLKPSFINCQASGNSITEISAPRLRTMARELVDGLINYALALRTNTHEQKE